ncbi:N-6 DNA methylase [Bacillus sp. FSL R5-0432]|uniref:Eco57I restriction-modification methylase domain-containing protein n=1 Tax=unclassified Bacillus (in: firmicutes) TaxID=185979 RepID=UPI00057CE652|nr:N-6 DNA methylase [Bacillus sp. WP8]AIZ61454.1 hypothetical protein QR42_14800 [Bacillus sp. WP8]
MSKLVELMYKHWEYAIESKKNEYDLQRELEIDIAVGLGKSILLNNINILGYDIETRKIIINRFESMFNTTFTETIPINSKEVINPLEYDVVGRVYESFIHNNGTRKSSGSFYSPIEVVNYIVESLGLDEEDEIISKRFIDIACGTGVFLLSAIKKYIEVLKRRGYSEEVIIKTVMNNIYGLDINPVSCIITKLNIFNFLLFEFSSECFSKIKNVDFNIYSTNSIENRSDIFTHSNASIDIKIKLKLDEFMNGFDYIIGNPPYLEAKKMPKDLKEICKANYKEEIFGAFDLYIAFLAQCNRLSSENGIVSLILPNKFTVAKYAKKIREIYLNNYSLVELIDLSEMDIFSKADVYPIVFTYKNTKPNTNHKVRTKMSVKNYVDLFDDLYATEVPQELYKQIGDMNTYFCLPKSGDFKEFFVNLFSNYDRIDKYLEFRSTVSFHKKGLREQFVGQTFNNIADKSNIRKYLGGLSYSKKNEVSRYKIDWNEYYINYDNEYLKSIGNALPPIENFNKRKIIFCQHAKEITATYDGEGEWVTKDVFPIAFEKEEIDNSDLSVKYLTGLLNSKLYSFIYGIIYKGIQIAGGYYHFLPTWMSVLPIYITSKDDIKHIEMLVDEALSNQNDLESIIDKIDEKIFDIYSVNHKQREIIFSFFGDERKTKNITMNI